MIPRRYEPFVFALVLSGLMSLIVSAISTARTLGLVDGFVTQWLANWLSSWLVAYPSVLVVSPIARKLVHRLVRQPGDA